MSPINLDQIGIDAAPDVLRNHRRFVLSELERCGNVLQFVSDRLRADREVVLTAVRKWPANLKYAAPDLRDDKTVVIEAVSRVGFALQFASDRLRSDKAVVRAALQTDPRFLIDTPAHLLSGVVKLLENRREILLHASSELQTDRELIYLAEG